MALTGSDNNEDQKKKKDIVASIPNWGWLLLSFLVAMALWYLLSVNPVTKRSFPFLPKVVNALKTMVERGVLWADFSSSMISVILGFVLGFVTSVPVAFLMAWYRPVRYIVEPWIQLDVYKRQDKCTKYHTDEYRYYQAVQTAGWKTALEGRLSFGGKVFDISEKTADIRESKSDGCISIYVGEPKGSFFVFQESVSGYLVIEGILMIQEV